MITDLRRRLDEAIAKHGVPGASIAVSRDGEVVAVASGVLNLNTKVEATTDALFQVGSTTKVFTAALIMQLVEEGLLDLDKPVRTYLPEFGLADEAASASVTTRQLLTHTAGFEGDVFEDTGVEEDCLDRYLKFLAGVGQVHAPGELMSYCNAGYVVLGALVARLRGTTWEQAMRERLFAPLGIGHSAFSAKEAIVYRVSAGHIPGPDGPAVSPDWEMARSNAPAGSTMCLTPSDLLRFGRTLMRGGVTDDGSRILSAESVAAMLTPQVSVPGVLFGEGAHWGLGIALYGWGDGAYGHDGGTIGQSTTWVILPGAGLTLAMTMNGGDVMGLMHDFVHPIFRELAGVEPPASPVPPADPVQVDLSAYVGAYESGVARYEVELAEGGGIDVTLVPSELMVKLGSTRETVRYLPLGGHAFVGEKPERGRHPVLAFVMENGQASYLHNSRALARVP
ncbi:serine hydrolase domain-containing protein [Rhizohabitans arisaemae]|uniref:serine hydrolase domain-containing protein n=1 Tax=Rhizohabitans arisaemae TaxID=2720610 RepID=UPI0024B281C1|nr:serine hydrolase domain-containing protein [Rhizohabitans arisaemae]